LPCQSGWNAKEKLNRYPVKQIQMRGDIAVDQSSQQNP